MFYSVLHTNTVLKIWVIVSQLDFQEIKATGFYSIWLRYFGELKAFSLDFLIVRGYPLR